MASRPKFILNFIKDEILPHVQIVFQVEKRCSVEIETGFCVLGSTFHVAWLHVVGKNNRADEPPKKSLIPTKLPQLFSLRIS